MFHRGWTLLLISISFTFATKITVDPSDAIHETDEHYLSFTIDTGFLSNPQRWVNFDYRSNKLQNLMSALAPAILRIGGTSADFTFFDTPNTTNSVGLLDSILFLTVDDWDNFNWLVRGCGLRLLYDLNIQTRFGGQWNPTNAIALMDYSVARGYAENLDFELGNEPNHGDHPDKPPLDTSKFYEDFSILYKTMRQYPEFQSSRLVGPDTTNGDPITTDNGKILQNLAEKAGFMDALTVHHYYFDGQKAKLDDYLNPKHFSSLQTHIQYVQDIIKNSSNPDMPCWIGETADAYHGGTEGISDRFASSFLWLEKLGLAASMGVKVVMRQTLYGGNYPLLDENMDPNPDYWLSYLFKKIVGRHVLKVVTSNNPNTTRVYAHMTNTKDCEGPSDCYPEGSVTVFALNMDQENSDKLSISGTLSDRTMDAYVVTTGDTSAGPLSKIVNLNGKPLKLDGDKVPWNFEPKRTKASDGFELPPLSYGYFVLFKM